MKDFDKIYDLFERACDEADEGITDESGLKKFRDVLDRIGEPRNKKADKENILYAYCSVHLGNALFSLALFESENGNENAMTHYREAEDRFRSGLNAFSLMEQTDDRDYLYADACQMFAGFAAQVCADDSGYDPDDIGEDDAEKYYLDSIRLYEGLLNGKDYDTREELVDVYYNAAGYRYEKGMSDKARPLFERSRALAEELENDEPGSYSEFIDSLAQYLGDDIKTRAGE